MTTKNKMIAGFAFAACGMALAFLVAAVACQMAFVFDHIHFFQSITVVDGAESVVKTCGVYFGQGNGVGECYFMH